MPVQDCHTFPRGTPARMSCNSHTIRYLFNGILSHTEKGKKKHSKWMCEGIMVTTILFPFFTVLKIKGGLFTVSEPLCIIAECYDKRFTFCIR